MPLAAAQRLKIGLSACFSHADPARPLFTGKTLQYVEQSLVHWLMSTGAMVVVIPSLTGQTAQGDASLAHYAQWLDGVVMHGGADVWPGSYGEQPLRPEWQGDQLRDQYDLAVVEAFSQAGKPIFGVCRGLQLINVAFGGTLYQDIQTQVPRAQMHRNAPLYDRHQHAVQLVQGSRLAGLYPGVEQAQVNSIHHQGIKDVAPGFVVEAWSVPDGIAEAICRADMGAGYIAATQWHPEFADPQGQTLSSTPLLHDFLHACAQSKRQAEGKPMRSPLPAAAHLSHRSLTLQH